MKNSIISICIPKILGPNNAHNRYPVSNLYNVIIYFRFIHSRSYFIFHKIYYTNWNLHIIYIKPLMSICNYFLNDAAHSLVLGLIQKTPRNLKIQQKTSPSKAPGLALYSLKQALSRQMKACSFLNLYNVQEV